MEKKLHPLGLLAILTKYSDKNRPLSQPAIREILYSEYGISICRSTFYDSIAALKHYKFKISTYAENRKGYYLVSRQLSKAQAFHLCHAVYSSACLSARQREELTEALLRLISDDMKKELREMVFTIPSLQTPAADVLDNIDLLHMMISSRQRIEFYYYHYNEYKQLVKRQKPFTNVEPRFIVHAKNRVYLIATGIKENEFSHFRLDKITDLRMLNGPENRVSELPENMQNISAYDYAANKLFMFTGERIHCTFWCNRHIPNIYDKMIDELGEDAHWTVINDDWIEIRTYTTESGAIHFAMAYIDAVKIIEPCSVRNQLSKYLKKNLSWYE